MKSSKSYAMRALVAMCIMYSACSGIAWNTLTLYADPVVLEWGVTRTQFLAAVTIVAFTNAAMSFVYGAMESKLGVRKLMLLGGLLSTASLGVMASCNSLPVFYAAALALGIGFSPLNYNTSVIVLNSWFKKNVGTYVGIPTTCSSVSGVAFSAIYGFLIMNIGWRPAMWITTGIFLIATIVMQMLYRGDPKSLGVKPMYADEEEVSEDGSIIEEETGVGLVDMLKSGRFWILFVGFFLIGVAGNGAMGNLALLSADLGYGTLTGTVLSAALVGSAATMVLDGVIMDKIGSKWLLAGLMVLACVAMFVLRAQAVALPLVYVSAVLVGMGYNATQIVAGITCKEVFGSKEYTKKVGILTGVCFSGLSFGPTILSAIAEATGGYSTALTSFIGVAVVAVVLIFMGARPVKN